jgi:polyhydroxybutyrate depolymerase
MGSQHRVLPRQAGLIAALLLVSACSSGDDDRSAPTAVAERTTTTAPCSTIGEGEDRVVLDERWYLRHVPPAHDGTTAVPLVIALHGYNEGAERHAGATGWGELGDEHGFVTIMPNALGEAPAWDLEADGVDVRFVEDIIDHAQATLCIDPDRVYVTGHSMGGFLISTLACTIADRVAAFAPVAGVRAVDCDEASDALVIHGTGDGVVLYDGGLNTFIADVLDLPAEGPSIPSIVDAWDARSPGADVVLQRMEGGSHQWPRSATRRIWAFFETHPRD